MHQFRDGSPPELLLQIFCHVGHHRLHQRLGVIHLLLRMTAGGDKGKQAFHGIYGFHPIAVELQFFCCLKKLAYVYALFPKYGIHQLHIILVKIEQRLLIQNPPVRQVIQKLKRLLFDCLRISLLIQGLPLFD